MKPRQMTNDEVRDAFLEHIHGIVEFWANDKSEHDVKRRLEGVAFSILVLLDGNSGNMPSFVVAPSPHPDDREFQRKQGENWFPQAETHDLDIAGTLHEEFYREEREQNEAAARG